MIIKSKNIKNIFDLILLDNNPTVNLFFNRKLLFSLWKYEEPMTVHGNGGSLTTHTKAYINNYGKVWFHGCAITNILSLNGV